MAATVQLPVTELSSHILTRDNIFILLQDIATNSGKMSGISCHVIPEIRSHFHPLTLHFHYDMILQSRHSRIHTHRPYISGVDRFRSCNAIHADASVRSCICPRCIQPRRRGGCRPRYTGVVGPACPSSSTGHPPPIASGPYCLLARLGNSVWGFSEGSSRGGRRQLSFPLFLFIIVLIVVYDID